MQHLHLGNYVKTIRRFFYQERIIFSRHASVDRDGQIQTEDSQGQNIFNSKKMTKEEEQEMLKKVNQEIQLQQQQFQHQMQQFQEQVEKKSI